jgi:hypothetical protein
MIECRHCREVFRTPLENLGARCPNCRLPLFDRSERMRPSLPEPGPCAYHPESESVSRCRRCGQRLCATCRTRWHEEILCPECAGHAFLANESSARELRGRDRLAGWSLVLALLGWLTLLTALIPWFQVHQGRAGSSAASWTLNLAFLSLIPALFALGQAAWAVRQRVQAMRLATSGLVLGGLQIGLLLGVMLLNLWHN